MATLTVTYQIRILLLTAIIYAPLSLQNQHQ